MKLKSILKVQPLATLESIHSFWQFNEPRSGDPEADEDGRRHALIEFLYPRLQLRHSFQSAWIKLSQEERDLIYFLAIHGGDVEVDELATRCFGGDRGPLDALVASLTEKGFVFFDQFALGGLTADMAGLPEPYLRYVDLPSYWEGYLGSFLRDLPTPRLKAIANQGLKLRLSTNKKHLLAWRIRRELTNPERLRRHVAELKPAQREILDQLLARRGISVYRDLLDQNYQMRIDQQRAEELQRMVQSSGLVYVAVEGENRQNSVLMAPRDLAYMIAGRFHPDRRNLRELDTVSATADEAKGFVLDNSSLILRDLTIFVALTRARAPRVLTGGGIGRNDLKKILPSLSAHKTLKYARFLALFCIQRKFLIPAGEVWASSNLFEPWLKDSQAAYRDLYSYWLNSTAWNEEYIDGDLAHAESPPANLLLATDLRRMTLRNLESIPHDDWIDFDAFAEALVSQVDAKFARENMPGAVVRHRHAVLTLESIIAESLHWLGVLALGMSSPAKLPELGSRLDEQLDPLVRQGVNSVHRRRSEYAFSFKPTNLGRQMLDSDSLDPERLFAGRGNGRVRVELNGRQFLVQPNLEILAPPDLRLDLLAHLCRFSEPLSVDVMTTLTITRRSVRKAMDEGLDGRQILQFLDENSSLPTPDTVRALIAECSSKHGEVDMGYAGGYIHASDPALLEEIRSNRRVRDFLQDTLGSEVLTLAPGADVEKLGRELRKAGLMPRVQSRTAHVSSAGDFQIRLQPDDFYELLGLLKFVVAIEDDLGRSLSQDKARRLTERLQTDFANRITVADFADAIFKGVLRRYRTAEKEKIEAVAGRYRQQLERLLKNGASIDKRQPFAGPNPALDETDIRRMMEFAIVSESRVEISYRHLKNGPVIETIEPESLEGEKVRAFSNERDAEAVFSLPRIRKARLL